MDIIAVKVWSKDNNPNVTKYVISKLNGLNPLNLSVDDETKEVQFFTHKNNTRYFNDLENKIYTNENIEIKFIIMPLMKMELDDIYMQQLESMNINWDQVISTNFLKISSSPLVFTGFKKDLDLFYNKLNNTLMKIMDTNKTSSFNHHPSSAPKPIKNAVKNDVQFVSSSSLDLNLSRINVKILSGSLIEQNVDAIVSPSGPHLSPKAGVGHVIFEAAGDAMKKECARYIRANTILLENNVLTTTSGNLRPAILYVIHLSMAHRFKSENDAGAILEESFINCFKEADKNLNISTLALPFIGTGVLNIPIRIVAKYFVDAIFKFDVQKSSQHFLSTIMLINVDSKKTHEFIQAVNDHPKLRQISMQNGNYNGNTIKTSSDRIQTRSSSKDNGSEHSNHSPIHTPAIRNNLTPRSMQCCVCLKTIFNSGITNNNCKHIFCTESCAKLACLKCANNKVMIKPKSEISSTDVEKMTYADVTASALKLTHSKTFDDAKRNSNSEVTSVRKRSSSVSRTPRQNLLSEFKPTKSKDDTNINEHCVICMENIVKKKNLSCGHAFCADCIDQYLAIQNKCPICMTLFGTLTGNQPKDGRMRTKLIDQSLPGYGGCKTIQIDYSIPSGIQQDNHPNPGQSYDGTRRTAYLPDNAEGKEVCELLKKAFDNLLIFTIGKSTTNGKDNVVTWNDIHHKTTISGFYGYPDDGYLKRVKEELAAKGVFSLTENSRKK